MSDNKNLVPEAELRRRWEGQLNKFTNVVKGYQFRWFVLDPESGTLQYYLLNEENGKCRYTGLGKCSIKKKSGIFQLPPDFFLIELFPQNTKNKK